MKSHLNVISNFYNLNSKKLINNENNFLFDKNILLKYLFFL